MGVRIMRKVPQEVEPASVFLAAIDPEKPDCVPWQVVAVIRAADAVFFDPGIAARVLDLFPQCCFCESAADVEITRMRKLAGEGWRVVRLMATTGCIAAEADRLGAAGVNVRLLSEHDRGENRAYPELFTTSLNGLAG
jgi:hypothetical protein